MHRRQRAVAVLDVAEQVAGEHAVDRSRQLPLVGARVHVLGQAVHEPHPARPLLAPGDGQHAVGGVDTHELRARQLLRREALDQGRRRRARPAAEVDQPHRAARQPGTQLVRGAAQVLVVAGVERHHEVVAVRGRVELALEFGCGEDGRVAGDRGSPRSAGRVRPAGRTAPVRRRADRTAAPSARPRPAWSRRRRTRDRAVGG